jgi:molybdenum cofactor cytidylyltransferase
MGEKMKIAMIMLAAGNSRRFGSNKLIYEIEGKPMYAHVLAELLRVREELTLKNDRGETLAKVSGSNLCALDQIGITVVTQYEEIGQAAEALGIPVFYNPDPDRGISSSLQIGLNANLDADACLFTVSDQPWLQAKTVEELISLYLVSGKNIASVGINGSPGNPCIFGRKYYRDLLALTGDKGGKKIILSHMQDTAILEITDVRELTDVDYRT